MRRFDLLAVGVLAAASGCGDPVVRTYDDLPAVGAPVPAFAFPTLGGDTASSAGLRGRPAVVALWSSHCSASRLALDAIGALHAAYAPRGVRVLVVTEDPDASAVRPLLARAHTAVPVAVAGDRLTATFSQATRWPWRRDLSLPSFLVLDAAGRVLHREVGVALDSAARLGDLRRFLDSLPTTRTGG